MGDVPVYLTAGENSTISNTTGGSAAVVADAPSQRWIIGLMLGTLGSISINMGNNLQSLGMKELERDFADRKVNSETDENVVVLPTPSWKSKKWLIGTIVFVFGNIMNFLAFAFAAQSLLVSLEAIQFVSNIFFNYFVLKANVIRRMWIGTLFTVMGTVLIVAFASKEELKGTVEDLMKIYYRWDYLLFIGLFIVFSLSNYFGFKHFRAINLHRKEEGLPIDWRATAEPICFIFSASLFGTQAVVQAKTMAGVLERLGDQAFYWGFTYIAVISWLVIAGIYMYRINEALGMFDPLFVIPLFVAAYMLGAVISGGIVFDEFSKLDTVGWICFMVGMVCCLIGLYLLRPETDEEKREVGVAEMVPPPGEFLNEAPLKVDVGFDESEDSRFDRTFSQL